MKLEVKDNKLIIEIELEKSPRPSKSGKTKVVASTGGFKVSDAKVDGQMVSVSVNATIPA